MNETDEFIQNRIKQWKILRTSWKYESTTCFCSSSPSSLKIFEEYNEINCLQSIWIAQKWRTMQLYRDNRPNGIIRFRRMDLLCFAVLAEPFDYGCRPLLQTTCFNIIHLCMYLNRNTRKKTLIDDSIILMCGISDLNIHSYLCTNSSGYCFYWTGSSYGRIINACQCELWPDLTHHIHNSMENYFISSQQWIKIAEYFDCHTQAKAKTNTQSTDIMKLKLFEFKLDSKMKRQNHLINLWEHVERNQSRLFIVTSRHGLNVAISWHK